MSYIWEMEVATSLSREEFVQQFFRNVQYASEMLHDEESNWIFVETDKLKANVQIVDLTKARSIAYGITPSFEIDLFDLRVDGYQFMLTLIMDWHKIEGGDLVLFNQGYGYVILMVKDHELAPIQWRKSEETGTLNRGAEDNDNRAKKLHGNVQTGSGTADGNERQTHQPACP